MTIAERVPLVWVIHPELRRATAYRAMARSACL